MPANLLNILKCSATMKIYHQIDLLMVFQLSSRSICSCSKAVYKPVWHLPVPNVQWKTPDDGYRKCPKHVRFLDKSKFGKLMRLLDLLKRNLQNNYFLPTSSNLLLLGVVFPVQLNKCLWQSKVGMSSIMTSWFNRGYIYNICCLFHLA